MANTKDTMGEAACLDALVADTLTSFEDDEILQVGPYGLSDHEKLTDVTFSQCASVETYGFFSSSYLTKVDILGTGHIGSYAFNSCSRMNALILRGNNVTSFNDLASAFSTNPIACEEGAIYVPSNLIDSYKTVVGHPYSGLVIASIDAYPLSSYDTITDSWSTIIANCANGTTDSYSLGDTKSISIDGADYIMKLVGKNVDVLASDGITTVPTTWIMSKKLYGTKKKFNETRTTVGGWTDSGIRSWLSNTVLPLLPSEVQSAIKEVRKYSGTYENSAIVKDGAVTSDKLWIPSAREMNVHQTTYETLGPTYSAVYSTTSRFGFLKYYSGSPNEYVLRSVQTSSSVRTVSSSGQSSDNYANQSFGVAFGFCI